MIAFADAPVPVSDAEKGFLARFEASVCAIERIGAAGDRKFHALAVFYIVRLGWDLSIFRDEHLHEWRITSSTSEELLPLTYSAVISFCEIEQSVAPEALVAFHLNDLYQRCFVTTF